MGSDLTPPPMSDAELWKVHNAWCRRIRSEPECETTFDMMQMALAARDEQWRQRLEVAAHLHTMDNTDGIEGNEPYCILSFEENSPFGVPGEDYSEEFPITAEPLYRIKEQG